MSTTGPCGQLPAAMYPPSGTLVDTGLGARVSLSRRCTTNFLRCWLTSRLALSAILSFLSLYRFWTKRRRRRRWRYEPTRASQILPSHSHREKCHSLALQCLCLMIRRLGGSVGGAGGSLRASGRGQGAWLEFAQGGPPPPATAWPPRVPPPRALGCDAVAATRIWVRTVPRNVVVFPTLVAGRPANLRPWMRSQQSQQSTVHTVNSHNQQS